MNEDLHMLIMNTPGLPLLLTAELSARIEALGTRLTELAHATITKPEVRDTYIKVLGEHTALTHLLEEFRGNHHELH